MANIGIHQRAGCQVPPVADWAKGQHPRRLITDCFGTGRDHKLNHLRRLSVVRGSKWMSGPAGMQGPPAVRHKVRSNEPRSSKCALSRARPENSRFLLTDDFHGGRQTGTYVFSCNFRFVRDSGVKRCTVLCRPLLHRKAVPHLEHSGKLGRSPYVQHPKSDRRNLFNRLRHTKQCTCI